MIVRFWFSVFFWCSVSSDQRRTGINDCVLVKNEYVTTTVTKSVPREERKFRFCWSIPPRCSYRVTKYITQRVREKHPVERKSWACCSGYKIQRKFMPTSADDELSFPTCVPQCQDRCYPYGTCIAPFVCLCNNGKKKNKCTKKDYIKKPTVAKAPTKSTTTSTITRTEKTSTSVSSSVSDSQSVTSEVSQTFSSSVTGTDYPEEGSTNSQYTNSIITSESQSIAVESSEDRPETTESTKQVSDIDIQETSEYGTSSVMTVSTNQSSDTTENRKESEIDFNETSKYDSSTTENAKEYSDIDFSEASEYRSSTTESITQSFDKDVEKTSENLSNVIESTKQSTDIDIKEAIESSSSTTENIREFSNINFSEASENLSSSTENPKQSSDVDFIEASENSYSSTENTKQSSEVDLAETIENHYNTTEIVKQSSTIEFKYASKNFSVTTEKVNQSSERDFEITSEYSLSTTGNSKEFSNINVKDTSEYHFSTTEYTNKSSDEGFKKMNESTGSSSTPNLFWYFRNLDKNSSFYSDFSFDILKDVVPISSEEEIEEEENETTSSTHQPLTQIKDDPDNLEQWILSTIAGFTLFITLVLFGVIWFLRKRLRRWVVLSVPKNSLFRKDSGRVIAVSSSGNKEESKASSTLTLEPCDIEDHPKIQFPTKFHEDKYYFHEVKEESKIQSIG